MWKSMFGGLCVVLVCTCVCALPVLAQEPVKNEGAKKVTVYDFDGDTITGTFQHPDGIIVQGDLARKVSSLVKPRPNFLPELLKSVEDL